MEYLIYIWSVFLIVLFFGGSIFVHELGHFLAAKRRGLKIERFSIGFGPKIIRWERNGVEYCISLLPLGGYVALPQMADMGRLEGKQDHEDENGEPLDDEKPLPPISFSDKVIVAVMGAVFNLLFAFAIAILLWFTGQPSTEQAESVTIGNIQESIPVDGKDIPSPAKEAGLQPGDKILEISGRSVHNFTDIVQGIALGWDRSNDDKSRSLLKIERDGKVEDVEVFPRLVTVNEVTGEKFLFIGIMPYAPLYVESVYPDSPAAVAGIEAGDVVLAANGKKLFSVADLSAQLSESLAESDATVNMEVERDGKTIPLPMKPKVAITAKPMFSLTREDNKSEGIVFTPIYDTERPDAQMLLDNDATVRFETVMLASGSALSSVDLGDILVSVNGVAANTMNQLSKEVTRKNDSLELLFKRGDSHFSVILRDHYVSEVIPAGKRPIVGITFNTRKITINLNPLEQFRRQIVRTFQTLQSLVHPKSEIGVSNLSGPIGISRVLDHFATEDLDRNFSWAQLGDNFLKVLAFVVLLNINLAILNLMPIPVLDGGHILFAIIQKIRGRPIPIRIIGTIQTTFMLLLFFGLFIYVGIFDINRWRGDRQSERSYTAQERVLISPPVFLDE